MVYLGTGKRVSVSESWWVLKKKDATCTAGKHGTSVIFILLLLIARLLLELTLPLLFSSSKNTKLLLKGSAETREKYTGGARGGLPARNTLSIFALEEKKRHWRQCNISVLVNDPRRSIPGDVWNRLLVRLYPKLRQIREISYMAAKVMFKKSLRASVNPFTPGNFTENHVLKVVEPFSGHCMAIKSEKLPQNRLQVVCFAAFWSRCII